MPEEQPVGQGHAGTFHVHLHQVVDTQVFREPAVARDAFVIDPEELPLAAFRSTEQVADAQVGMVQSGVVPRGDDFRGGAEQGSVPLAGTGDAQVGVVQPRTIGRGF
ncbi:MAG: hypothetical protein V1929_09680 [bacterium]